MQSIIHIDKAMQLYNIVKMILRTKFYTNYSICLVVKKLKKIFLCTEPCHQVYGKLCPRSVSVPRSGGHRSVAEGVAVFIGGHSRVKKMKQR